MSDNGGSEQKETLTPEEIAINKRKAFENNPDEFIHVSEIIIGTRVLSNGAVQCIIGNPNRLLLEISMSRIQYEVIKTLMILEQAGQPKIIKPKGGIMDFVRRK